MVIDTLAVVGVGLIGASVGLAAKRYGVAGRVVGSDRDPDHLRTARDVGAIDDALDFSEAVGAADLTVVAVPVGRIYECVVAAAEHVKPGAVLTDTGSVQGPVASAARAVAESVAVVGSHPVAGSEKAGPAHAVGTLFRDRLVVLTRTVRTTPSAATLAARFWVGVGAGVRWMDPADHDRGLARTSHLPHLLAAVLAAATPEELLTLTGGGFRDATRIAAGDPDLWAGILCENAAFLRPALDDVLQRLHEFRDRLDAADRPAVRELLARGKKVRDALGN